MELIKGFSKLSREEKISVIQNTLGLEEKFEQILSDFLHPVDQALFDDFSENTISNFYLPFGVAPNFLIDGELFFVPMVVEESSVVAAASKAASFWANNGGFKTIVHNDIKTGHIWFNWDGDGSILKELELTLADTLKRSISELTKAMEQRGAGIKGMEILPLETQPSSYQLLVSFKTADSMGANFINTCLESMKKPLTDFFVRRQLAAPDIIMAILSNYNPDCLVSCSVSCRIEALKPFAGSLSPAEFAHRFKQAVDIAKDSPNRAVTHNKGIFNGIDAVVIATGNDFRAVEAAGHAYAARDGNYKSLSTCNIDDEYFYFSLELPLALGTVGGLTKLHPLARLSLAMLKNPSAHKLMGIVAAAGLANNFSALAALLTTGIQKGHMKLHLSNILNTFKASKKEKNDAEAFFQNRTVSHNAVKDFLSQLRNR